jgi:hypothetical protein
MEEVRSYRQLKSKTNFISWKQGLSERPEQMVALEFPTGEGVVLPKPRKEKYFVRAC